MGGGMMRRILLVASLVLAPAAAFAQSATDLAPPADLDAQGVPTPVDSTAIMGNQPPAGEMAIPVPPSTCGPLAAMVRQNGFVLIPTGGGNAQRYVRDANFCDNSQNAKPAWVPTDDNPKCFIGYTCGAPNMSDES